MSLRVEGDRSSNVGTQGPCIDPIFLTMILEVDKNIQKKLIMNFLGVVYKHQMLLVQYNRIKTYNIITFIQGTPFNLQKIVYLV